MYARKQGFTLIELVTVLVIVAVALVLAIPSFGSATQKRRLTGAVEQSAALLNTAQSEAIKRNSPVSLSHDRSGGREWCLGSSVGLGGCDCTETDPSAAGFCEIAGASARIGSGDFESVILTSAQDVAPGGGDGRVVFDPVRGILEPVGDQLLLSFESGDHQFRLDVRMASSGLLRICNPDTAHKVPGYEACS